MTASRRTQLLGVGALALLAAGIFGAGVPLYDGVGFPDDPYRYIAPPVGAKVTPPAEVARVTTDVTSGTNPQGFEVATLENGPQVSIYVPASSLLPADGATTVTVTATPLAALPPMPPNGPVTGNVYRVTASAGASLARGTAGTITLRAPVGFKVIPVLDFRALGSSSWAPVQTSRVGNDIFEAPFTTLGDYATILPTHGSSASGGSSRTIIVVLLVFLALALITIAVVRGFRSISDVELDASERDDADGDDSDD